MASDNSRRAARFGRLSTDAPVPADQQSVIPGVPGVPWWGAVLIAAVLTAIGATVDALMNSSLGVVYNLFFLFGCVIAALAVRRRALFTAAVQPPLISVFIGLTSLWGMAQAAATNNRPQGMRQVVLNVALPFSNLFPWIAGVFLATLLVVLVRWFLTRGAPAAAKGAPAKGARPAAAAKTKAASTTAKPAKNKAPGKAKKKPPPAKRDTANPATAKAGGRDTRKPAKPRPAQPDPRNPRAETAPTGQRRPARRPVTGEQGRPDHARPAEARPEQARSADPRTAEPGPELPRPEQALPEQAGGPGSAPQRVPSGGAAVPGSRPVRKAPTVVGQTSERPVRRASPKVIPPRPGTDRPRRTAGQSLREQGAVEDLTLGIDD